jgi:hypothetical protein
LSAVWPVNRVGVVVSAMLVDPRTFPVGPLKRTNARTWEGKKGRALSADTKNPKVGVALAAIVVVTDALGTPRQAPVVGLVWQIVRLTGRVMSPQSTLTATEPAMPRLTVATAKAPGWLVPDSRSTPSCVGVAAKATTSAGCELSADTSNVLTPMTLAAGAEPEH